MKCLKVFCMSGRRCYRNSCRRVVCSRHTYDHIDHRTLTHIRVSNHAQCGLLLLSFVLAICILPVLTTRFGLRCERLKHTEELLSEQESIGVSLRLNVNVLRLVLFASVELVLLALGREKDEGNLTLVKVCAPGVAHVIREIVSLVNEQQGPFVGAELTREVLHILTTEEERVASIYDLHDEVATLHNTPELTPIVKVLLKRSHMQLVIGGLHGGDLATPRKESLTLLARELSGRHIAGPCRTARNGKTAKVKRTHRFATHTARKVRYGVVQIVIITLTSDFDLGIVRKGDDTGGTLSLEVTAREEGISEESLKLVGLRHRLGGLRHTPEAQSSNGLLLVLAGETCSATRLLVLLLTVQKSGAQSAASTASAVALAFSHRLRKARD
mmetsp:Transcript_15235/g.29555  ORF Transcript_15235/g.29555 Transcript_15235/m.29555 type:complete len:386 (+) Transcript_15235:836-1993(+)